ncbi:hypothetical protein JCM6882_004785 [Rhodosporidiobolus microsporus]
MRSLTLLALLGAPYAAFAARILALTDPALSSRADLSFDTFWTALRDEGHELVVKDVQDAALDLDERSTTSPPYEHLILFAPEAKQVPKHLTPQLLANRLSTHPSSSLLLVLSPNSAEVWRDFAREFEVDPDEKGQVVVDRFNAVSSTGDERGTTFSVPVSSSPAAWLSPSTRSSAAPLLYRGGAHLAGRNPLLQPALFAASSAFSADADSDAPPEEVRIAGSSAALVSTFQARNNARVGFVGSAEIFSDGFLSLDGRPTGNLPFLLDLARFVFQQTGQLRVESSKHVNAATGEEGAPMYKVGTEVTYLVKISSSPDVPSPLPGALQAEFTMLDPHLRVPLLPLPHSSHPPSLPNSTVYGATFRAPDRHGVFTLSLSYLRPQLGLTFLTDTHTVSVTPPNHNEYDRFIVGATPYYVGAASVSVGFAMFVVLWTLAGAPVEGREKRE